MGSYGDYRKQNALSWRELIWGVVFLGGLWVTITFTAGYGLGVGALCFVVLSVALKVLASWARRGRMDTSGRLPG
jgi:hypothetical protein